MGISVEPDPVVEIERPSPDARQTAWRDSLFSRWWRRSEE
jgi:hypothetical protein